MQDQIQITKESDGSTVYESKLKKTFFFHFNKPATHSAGKVQVSFHFWNMPCFIVDNVVCKTPCYGKMSKTQPRWVMKGKTNKFLIKDNIVTIL